MGLPFSIQLLCVRQLPFIDAPTQLVRFVPISEVADPSWRELIEQCLGLLQVERSWRGIAADVAAYTKKERPPALPQGAQV